MDSNEDRLKALETGVVEVAMMLRKFMDMAADHDKKLIEKREESVTELTRSIRVTDCMLMLIAKESGIKVERFEQIVEAASGHVVAAEMTDDMPPEVQEALDEIIAGLQAGDDDCVKH